MDFVSQLVMDKTSTTQDLTTDRIHKMIFNLFISHDGSKLLASHFEIKLSIQGNLSQRIVSVISSKRH